MFALTEEGRVFELTPEALREYVDGNWVKPVAPVSAYTLWTSRLLSDEELRAYLEQS